MKTNVYKFIMKDGSLEYAAGVDISASKYGLIYVKDAAGEKVKIVPQKNVAKVSKLLFESEDACYSYYAKVRGLL